jgi:stearoyl-CoA desaturase (delta-9 desaturase)
MLAKLNIPKINMQAFFALILLPSILLALCYVYSRNYDIGWYEVLLMIGSYYVCNITVGLGFHRLWSHNSYKTNSVVEFILVLLSAGTLQGPVLAWASDHYRHHTYTDEEQDPHTPLKYSSKIKGLLWSHIGWMIFNTPENKQITKIVIKKLGSNKLLLWQFKYYWQVATFMNVIVAGFAGYLFNNSLQGVFAGIVFIGIGRALQQHATFFINSLCHLFGTRKYSSNTSGDIFWLAPFLLGENWHNFHHAFPMDYRNGFKWYQFDVHKWLIYLMSRVGLAWDLNVTSDVRIQAKAQENSRISTIAAKTEWSNVKVKIDSLKDSVSTIITHNLEIVETSSIKMKEEIYKNLEFINNKLNYLSEQARFFMQLPENSSDALIKKATKQIRNFENSINKITAKFNSIASN